MGIENMRRWPTYFVFGICVLLTLSLFNSWSLETELRNKVAEISAQVEECSKQYNVCSKQQTSCMDESLAILKMKNKYMDKVTDLEKTNSKINNELNEYKNKAIKFESQVNRTLVDVELCKTELQSLKNLQVSKSATLETLRLEKETLTSKLQERKRKIDELEREIAKLKFTSTKSTANNPPAPAKITPAQEPPKQSPALNNNPVVMPVMNEPVLHEPAVMDNAQEDLEENMVNDGNDFEPQLH